ncbi:MAG: C40 family peptidase [Cyclobacteriaceae bacterium]
MIQATDRNSFFRQHVLLAVLLLALLSSCASQKKAVQRRDDGGRRVGVADSQATKVISTARSYTGTPYRWGGTSRGGMDCSGLLLTSFQSVGIQLPRTTSEQVRIGHNVGLYDLRPGDLVFFAAQKRRPGKITHVGMVTEVRDKHNVQFIHASTKLGVVENNIYSDYYRRIFVKARRVF